jgi:hypothetical protein
MKVGDKYRTSVLSLTPGGKTVVVEKYDSAKGPKYLEYTNIKKPQAYINKLINNPEVKNAYVKEDTIISPDVLSNTTNNVFNKNNNASSDVIDLHIHLNNPKTDLGPTCTYMGMMNVLHFFGEKRKYGELTGKKATITIEDGRNFIFHLNKDRCYCNDSSIRNEIVLHVINAKIGNLGAPSLF